MEELLFADFPCARDREPCELFLYYLLDTAELAFFPLVYDGYGNALAVGTSGPAATVRVKLYFLREIVIDDMGKPVYVDSPCGHIRRYEEMEGLAFEFAHYIVSLCLRQVSVQRICIVSVTLQGISYFLGFLPRFAENDSVNVRIEVRYTLQGFVTVFLPYHYNKNVPHFRRRHCVSRP